MGPFIFVVTGIAVAGMGSLTVSATNIPEKVKIRLWGKAAGRCQYEGCNTPLWLDTVTKYEFNIAYIAHIIADSPDGPRRDPALSKQLEADLSNLMLLCDQHHRLIDKEDVAGHPVERLRAMKEAHERRIEVVSGIEAIKQSHVLLYGANIGEQNSPVSYQKASQAMLPDWYPAETTPLLLGMVNSSFRDRTVEFWAIESVQLCNMVTQLVRPRLAQGNIQHLSIFAVAPQPLLILLGFLLSDLQAAEVYQLHREPPDWRWQEGPEHFEYLVFEPKEVKGPPALILSLSATISDERITTVLGKDVTIWRVTVAEPHNDFLKSRQQVQLFRQQLRRLMDRIKIQHGEQAVLHVFPAMPVALAVEVGRIVMSKADLSLRIYDENKELGGFVYALDLNTGNVR
jgi:hypothetical protein